MPGWCVHVWLWACELFSPFWTEFLLGVECDFISISFMCVCCVCECGLLFSHSQIHSQAYFWLIHASTKFTEWRKEPTVFFYVIWILDFLLSPKKTEKVKKKGMAVVSNEWCLKFEKFALHKIEINCGDLKRMNRVKNPPISLDQNNEYRTLLLHWTKIFSF